VNQKGLAYEEQSAPDKNGVISAEFIVHLLR
jgi:hypothetical protein